MLQIATFELSDGDTYFLLRVYVTTGQTTDRQRMDRHPLYNAYPADQQ